MQKKLLSILLVLVMLLCVVPFAFSASAADVTQISTPADMGKLMAGELPWDGHYELTESIDLTGVTQTPIGTADNKFTGTFDGKGYEITGLNLVNLTTDNVGLFGYLGAGAVIQNLTVDGTVSTTGKYAGGIVGRVQGVAVTIQNCHNKASVTGNQYVGGVVAYLYGSDSSTTVKNTILANCYNSGAVTSTSTSQADVGGVAGILWSVSGVSDCWSTGTVTYSAKNAGGIFGRTHNSIVVTNCYANSNLVNSGTSYTATTAAVRAFCGYPIIKNFSNCFYGTAYTAGNAVTGITAYADGSFDTLNANGKWINTTNGPELATFHVHTAANAEGKCDTCGLALSCAHEGTEKEWIVSKEATCSVTGLKEEKCLTCGNLTGVTEEIATVDTAHTGSDYVWHYSEANGYYYNCSACGNPMATQTDAPTVYVDKGTAQDTTVGNDNNSGLSASAELYTLIGAIERIAETGGTIVITDRFAITGDVTLPAHSKPITIKGGLGGSTTRTGFYVSAEAPRFKLGGDTTFENFLFWSQDAELNRTFVIVSNWHNLTIGDNVAASITGMIIAGTETPTEDDTTPADVTINLHGVEPRKDTGTSGVTLSSFPTFYNKIFLGNRTNGTPANAYVTKDKTVTLNLEEGVKGTTKYQPAVNELYLSTFAGARKPNASMEGCSTVVNAYDSTAIVKVVPSENVNGYTKTAATETTEEIPGACGILDSVSFNLYDNAVVSSELIIRNAREVTFYASTAAEGRTDKTHAPIFTFSNAYAESFVTGTETLSATYGSHSLTGDTATGLTEGTHYNAAFHPVEGKDTVYTVMDECTWELTEEVAPTCQTEGSKSYKCSVCEATKTDVLAIDSTKHNVVDGVCTICNQEIT